MTAKRVWTGVMVVMLLAASAGSARAATQYWDTAVSAGISGGNGTWNATDAQWATTPAGTTLGVWTSGSQAGFTGPSNGVASVVTLSNSMTVGAVQMSGSNYTLVVTNGGQMLAGSAASLIGNGGAGNTVIVAGGPAGAAKWEVGAAVVTQALTVGSGALGINNAMVVDGSAGGAVVTNVSALIVGNSAAAFNSFSLLNGARLYSGGLNVTSMVGNVSSSNTILLAGGGALWNGRNQALTVGSGARGNELRVDGLGVVGGATLTNIGVLALGAGSGAANQLIITNGGQAFATDLAIGSNNISNRVVVVGGGTGGVASKLDMGNSAAVFVGGGSGPSTAYNQLLVDGAGVSGGAVLTNLVELRFGSAVGANNNRATIQNGGQVFATKVVDGYNVSYSNVLEVLGGGSATATLALATTLTVKNPNFILVDGEGVGGSAVIAAGGAAFVQDGATLTVTNQGRLTATALTVGTGNSNTVVVTDAGSVVNLSGAVAVGSAAGQVGSVLRVLNGASITGAAFSVGVGAGSFSNRIVADQATLSSLGLALGSSGSSNAVTLANNTLWDLRSGLLVWGAGAVTNNELTVDASSSLINAGGLSLNDGGRTVYLTNQTMNGATVAFSGGALNIGTGPHLAPVGLVMSNFTLNPTGGMAGGASSIGVNCSNVAVSILPGALWNGGGQGLTVGSGAAGTNNLLRIDGRGVAGAAVVTNMNAVAISSSGLLVTDGGGFHSTNTLTAGGSGGSLTVAKGSAVYLAGSSSQIGSVSADRNNYWLITDPGSVLTINNSGGNAFLRYYGESNWLTVSNGGKFINGGYFTFGAGTNVAATITGPGSYMATAGSSGLQLGGSSNTFTVSNGGGVYVNSGTLSGNTASSYNNLLLVTGSGSVLTNAGNTGVDGLVIGNSSGLYGNHRVIISNGGAIINATAGTTLGYNGGHSNSVLVTGSGSVFSNASAIKLGVNGPTFISSFGMLIVSNGGKAISSSGLIGGYSNSIYNTAIVTDPGSVWQMSGGLTLAAWLGYGNQLLAANGGLVNVGAVTIGVATTRQNSVTLSGGGLVNSLGAVLIGGVLSANSNNATISGAGSLWTFGNQVLTVGHVASVSNSFTIDQGGAADGIATLTVLTNNSVNLLGGTLVVLNTAYTNGLFKVGDGVQAATLKSVAGGALSFNGGLRVNTNATLLAYGTVTGSGEGVRLLDNATLAGIGTVSGSGAGVFITNSATVAPGINGVGTLTIGGSNLTWGAGGLYDCAITNLGQGEGLGWSLLNVSSQLVCSGTAGSKMVIKLNSKGAIAAKFNPALNYNIKILSYGSQAGLNTSYISLDTNSFQPAGNVWSLTSTNNALYLTHTGTNANDGANLVWAVPSNGNWSAGANWTGGSAPVAGGSSTNVMLFGDNGTRYASTNNLPGSFTNNQMLFSSLYAGTNVISGSNLVFASNGGQSPRLDYLAGQATFIISNVVSLAAGSVFGGEGGGALVLASNVLGGQPLIKEGPWTLALAASNQFANPVVVSNGGVVRVDHSLALGRNSLVVTNGGLLVGTVAYVLGNLGDLRSTRVTGSGAQWTNSGALLIGSNATLTVDNGGRLVVKSGGMSLSNSYGTADAAVLVSNGGVLIYTNDFFIGNGSSSNTVKVTGAGSRMEGNSDSTVGTSYLTIGNGASTGNTFIVENFGFVTNTRFTVNARSSMIVSNNGSAYSTSITAAGADSTITILGGNSVTSSLGGILAQSGINTRVLIDGRGVDGSAIGTFSYGISGTSNALVVTNKGRYVSTQVGSGVYGDGSSLQVLDGSYAKIPVGAQAAGTGIGKGTGSNSYVLVSDAGSVLELSGAGQRFELGYEGYGYTTNYGSRLLVRNGGLLTNSANLGLACFVNGADRSTNCCNNFILVSATGQVYSSGQIQIANNVGVTGNYVKVTDTGTYWSMGNQMLTVGNPNALGLSTNNYFLLTDGAVMENVGTLRAYSNNQVYFNGGTLGLANAAISNGLPFVAGDGAQAATLKVQGGTLSVSSGLVITNNATLIGSGIVVGPSAVFGDLSLGLAGVGTLTNNGAFTMMTGSESRFDVVTNTGAGCDRLAVTNGTLTLAGTLTPVLKADFVPARTDRFLIMTNQSGSVAGSFANGARATIYAENLTTRVGTFKIEQGAQGVVLTDYQVWKSGGTLMMIR